MKTEDKNSWEERLKFYTRDMSKDERLELVDFIAYVKWKADNEDFENIKKAITNENNTSILS